VRTWLNNLVQTREYLSEGGVIVQE
jgi:hypothetical protein